MQRRGGENFPARSEQHNVPPPRTTRHGALQQPSAQHTRHSHKACTYHMRYVIIGGGVAGVSAVAALAAAKVDAAILLISSTDTVKQVRACGACATSVHACSNPTPCTVCATRSSGTDCGDGGH
ncbi:hypothetical protein EON67_04575 [archaeon]|nr:MAG: hypothetical protein EON67_04575 [archaeon]